MKIKVANEAYIEKAKLLSDEETERLLSRMGEKLRRRKDKEKVNYLEALAIQLEIEDEMLSEWRERFAEVKAKHDKKKPAPDASEKTAQKQPEAKTAPKVQSKSGGKQPK